jgi:hypothetical protein
MSDPESDDIKYFAVDRPWGWHRVTLHPDAVVASCEAPKTCQPLGQR